MNRHAVARLIVIAALATVATARGDDDPIVSGPQPGEAIGPFDVRRVLGPGAGADRTAIEPGEAPAVVVFVHELTRPALQLLRPIDRYGDRHKADGLTTEFVWLSADPTETEAFLRRAERSLDLRSPVSIALDGAEGPGAYGLNRNVAVTVLVSKGREVVASFAIVQPNETDAPRVLAEAAKLLGRPAPTLDELQAEYGAGRRGAAMPARPAATVEDRVVALEGQVRRLTEALNEARAKIARLEGTPPPEPLPTAADAPPARGRR